MNGFGKLRRVYVRAPLADDLRAWRAYDWHRKPDHRAATTEHEAFRALLSEAGAEVVMATPHASGDPDSIYTYDPTLITDEGAILLSPGKPGRRSEPASVARDLEAAGVPVVGRLEPPEHAEGGDMFFLDERTLLVGLGYRTNEPGLARIRALLEPSGIAVRAFDLPHLHGPRVCLHLMSLMSPLDADLVVGYPPLMPVRLIQLLWERDIELVEVPEEEFPTMGPNVLALGPRIALALDGNPGTRRRLEAAGVGVRTYRGEQISRNGDGGPTCLTRPLERS
jgi:dimethylargininase